MTDLTTLTDKELAKLLKDIEQARKIAIRPVLKYRARLRDIKAEIRKRVSEETETNKGA